MRIAAAQIDSFGIFRDLRLPDLPPGLVLVHGNNEAGKTTLLWFLRGMLFGFPHGHSKDPQYLAVENTAHGGQLTLITDDDRRFILTRSGTRRGGAATLTSPELPAGGPDQLNALLGHATADLFRNVYAFSLAELHSLDPLNAEGVKGAIHAAAAGTGIHALPQALKQLKSQLDALYKRRGQTQEINTRLAEWERTSAQLREVTRDADQYDALCAQLATTEAALTASQQQLAALRTAATRVDTQIKLRPEWLTWQDATNRLSTLPLIDAFPDDGLNRLTVLEDQLKHHEDRLSELQQTHARTTADLDALAVDQRLLAHAHAITTLAEGRQRYVDIRTRLPQQNQQLETVQSQISETLRRLSPHWTEQHIRDADTSVAAHEAIRTFAQQLDEARAQVARTEQGLTSRQETHAAATAAVQQATENLAQYEQTDLAVDEQVIAELQSQRALFARAVADLPGVTAEHRNDQTRIEQSIREIDSRWSPDDVARFDVSLTAKRRIDEFAHQYDEARDALREARTRRTNRAEDLDARRTRHTALQHNLEHLPPSPTPNELANRKNALRQLRAALHDHSRHRADLQHAEARLADKQQEAAHLTASLPHRAPALLRWAGIICIVLALAAILAAFASNSLPTTIATAVIFAALAVGLLIAARRIARTARTQQATLADVERTIAAIATDLEALRTRATETDAALTEHARALNLSTTPTAPNLNTLEETLDDAAAAVARRAHLLDQLRDVTAELTRAEQALADADDTHIRCEQTLAAIEAAWSQHVAALGLAPDSTLDTVRTVFERVSGLRNQLHELHAKATRIQQKQATCDAYTSLARQVPSLATACDASPTDLLSAIDRLLTRVRAQHERAQQRVAAETTLANARKHAADAAVAVESATAARDAAHQAQAATQVTWRTWLTARGLAPDLSPETALDALRLIQDCLRLLTQRQELTSAHDQLTNDIADYEHRAANIFTTLDQPPPAPADLPTRVAELAALAKHNADSALRRDEKQQILRDTQNQLESARQRVDQSAQHITELLAAAHADTPETFRTRGATYATRQTLQTEIAQAASNLRRISGQTDLAALTAHLAATSLEDLTTEQHRLASELAELEQTLNDLRDTRARLTNDIKRLGTADQVARLRADQERLRAELHPLVHQWSRLTLAHTLLQQARTRFEEQQQPHVIRDAAAFFETLTDHRYTRIVAPIGEDTVAVVTPDGQRRPPDQLSRGTAEQLYLALRFGYIRHRAARHERLPIVMDDILVNFDPHRAARAITAIRDLARNHQLLYFTCHPETVARFQQQDPTLPILRLTDGRFATDAP